MPGTPTPQPSQPDSAAPRVVRCPTCRREHAYEPPALPCPCGAALRVPLLRGGVPVLVRFRSWEDSWLSMRCPRCGRSEQWPQPEFTCGCGSVVRLPVDTTRPFEHPADRAEGAERAVPPGPATPGPLPPGAPAPGALPSRDLRNPSGPSPTARRPGSGGAAERPGSEPAREHGPARGHDREREHAEPAAPDSRSPFLPHPVRTSEDAVLAAARYLEWLGFGDLEVSDSQDRDGVCLLGGRIVAQVDTWTEPADLRAVECVWLNTLHSDELAPAMFTLAGYSREALNRADQLLVALFELDLAGMPQPVNVPAQRLVATGSTS